MPRPKRPSILRCRQSLRPCRNAAWPFWKAQARLSRMGLRLAGLRSRLKRSVNCDDRDGD